MRSMETSAGRQINLLVIFLAITVNLLYYIFYGEIIITEREQLWLKRSSTDGKHQKPKEIFYKTWGMSKKHQEPEKLLCIPTEQRRSSPKVGETPRNGEESPTFGEEPNDTREKGNNTGRYI